jgi:hypothetical protein
MIILAFFAGILVLGVVAAMVYDRRARRRGLRTGCRLATFPVAAVTPAAVPAAVSAAVSAGHKPGALEVPVGGGLARHMALFCNAAPGCRSAWYSPRHERDR